jgi:ribosomal protein S18 acetylase RimI-like enzyme
VNAPPLSFETIDLAAHAELCVAFRRDSYVCSFGSAERFTEEEGPEGYLEWLRGRIAEQPRGHVHVWQGSLIIGQLEMRPLPPPPPARGYVNLFYLVPAARGSGAGRALQEYVSEFMRSQGVQRVYLSASPSNVRALAYYKKHDWRDLGPSPRDASCQLLELDLSPLPTAW